MGGWVDYFKIEPTHLGLSFAKQNRSPQKIETYPEFFSLSYLESWQIHQAECQLIHLISDKSKRILSRERVRFRGCSSIASVHFSRIQGGSRPPSTSLI